MARADDVFTRLKLMGVLRETRRCWHFISGLRREEEHVELFARQNIIFKFMRHKNVSGIGTVNVAIFCDILYN